VDIDAICRQHIENDAVSVAEEYLEDGLPVEICDLESAATVFIRPGDLDPERPIAEQVREVLSLYCIERPWAL
jgi:hypothetical protein